MRLGGPVFTDHNDPGLFAHSHVKKGYTAAYCPDGLKAGDTAKNNSFKEALKKNDIIIAEVGAWCNPLSMDNNEADKNISYIIERLALADEMEAVTCVNVIGTWDTEIWYGPHADNFSDDFFDHAVTVYRRIVDAVKPKKAKMSFEIMPFSFLDSANGYLRFLNALDRNDYAAVHFDPVNCINSPRVFYDNGAYLANEICLLGDRIVSIHLKDIDIRHEPPSVMFDEVRIGTGQIDYVSLLKNISKLNNEIPVMLEHLPDEAQYDEAALHVRECAKAAGVAFY